MRPPAMVVVMVLLVTAAEAAHAAALVLERALPLKGVSLERIRELDRARHARMGPWVNITVEGTVSPLDNGLYYASVKLGNPSKKHTFQIDTGSGISWVACKGCTDCLTKSVLNISTGLYNPDSSSTSSRISCLDDSCAAADETGSAVCQTPFSLCGYNFTYGDETRVSGYYVSDTMYFDSIMGNQRSASVVFGYEWCKYWRVVILDNVNHLHIETGATKFTSFVHRVGTTNDGPNCHRMLVLNPADGILGFAQNQLSFISQLHSQGVSPKMFSHCLKGSEEGGGILVLGEIVAPRLVFTPLVSSQYLYALNLEGIAVNGRKLPIDSSLFATSNLQGTIIDTGTTIAYLVDGAYQPLVSAIFAAISPSVATYDSNWNGKGDKCFQTSSSIDLLFPTVTLYFKGGAAMTVEPSQYLLQQGVTVGNAVVWCIAWQSSKVLQNIQGKNIQGMTILGDIVLHDKLIVYDLAKMRMGWTNYNCSSLNMTSSFDVSGASPYYIGLIAIGMAVVFLGALLLD